MVRARRELACHPDRPRARLLVFLVGAGPLRRAAGPSLPYLRSGHPETRNRSLELDRASRVRKIRALDVLHISSRSANITPYLANHVDFFHNC
jgi:hypothetical protein